MIACRFYPAAEGTNYRGIGHGSMVRIEGGLWSLPAAHCGGAIMKRKPPALRSIDLNRRAVERFSCGYPVELHHGCAHRFLSSF